MALLVTFIGIVFAALVAIPFAGSKGKGLIAVTAIVLNVVISSIFAIKAVTGAGFECILPGSFVTGDIPIRIDALSGWFILTINFSFLTGAMYGFHYLKAYRNQTANLSLHYIVLVLIHGALISICSIQNSVAFLIAWEIMALSSFIAVIFEHQKRETLKAGINFLIQAHVSILFLTIAFIWAASRTGSFDFKSLETFSKMYPSLTSLALFLVFFIGFAIKAGFVPFHTWLPYAHPAAPAHVSGLMSGVIIKIGIYGILRMILLVKSDYTIVGYIILIFSVVSAVYGVMLAILQHNLKKLLAYHSIENIGIIGIGIGLGCIGLGSGNQVLAVLGFAGAMLHTLNHSLFKSLLFYGAGNVYQATHTMSIDQLGGLNKRMPHTTFLFLIPALAICGLPPFNGFISEFLIYSGLFKGMKGVDITTLSIIIFSIFGLTLVGGLALLCFTKAFGTVFLGTARRRFAHSPDEASPGKLIPMYAIVVVMTGIGLFPQFVIQLLTRPVGLFTNFPGYNLPFMQFPYTDTLTKIGFGALGLLILTAAIFFIRKYFTSRLPEIAGETWGCGYVAPTAKIQYTASSFVRSYRKLAEPLLSIHKHKKDVEGIFPTHGKHETHPDDKMEEWLIRLPLLRLRHFFNRFTFLQNGNPQVYILYGVVFITLVLGVPMIYDTLKELFQFLNHL
jgi:formate hydrogenlyase subunit 3/multisubunit Na+/H+ antiporter MnhD subunit